MSPSFRMTVIVENSANRPELLGEHGLALWIEVADRKILFDTGQGMALTHNAAKLQIDLGQTTDIVISHGHYDHTGGLETALSAAPEAVLYAHPKTFAAKYVKDNDGSVRSVGAPVQPDTLSRAIHFNTEPVPLADGVWITGEIPRRHAFEDVGGAFFLDEQCNASDDMVDERALFVQTSEGLVVVTGCGHAGLVNTLDHVAELSGANKMYGLAGGLHLLNASEERIGKSLDSIERYDVQKIATAHCTGLFAIASVFHRFANRFVALSAGQRIEIE